MTYSRLYPQTITADGTDIQTGFENDDNELKRIYGLLDSVGAISLAGTKRQSVLYASTLNGEPNFLSASGLNVSLNGSATNVLLALAYGFDDKGAVDYISKIGTLISNAWTLPGNSTVYLYIDRDISTGLISYNYSTLEDLYQKATPTATLDQHWYDTNECKMKRYNGSTWETKQRLFVAKAVTDASATTLTIYPLQSRVPQLINVTGNADTSDKVNHTLTIGANTFDGSANTTIGFASQAEAEEGTDDGKIVTPLKVKQAITSQRPTYITETYHNGTEWYRVWSDGFIEQGGHGMFRAAVTFLKAFSNTDYSLNVTSLAASGSAAVSVTSYSATTFNSQYLNYGGTFSDTAMSWKACGY